MKHNKPDYMSIEGGSSYNPEQDPEDTEKRTVVPNLGLEKTTVPMNSEEILEAQRKSLEFNSKKTEFFKVGERRPLNITVYGENGKKFYKGINFDIGEKIGKGGQTSGVFEATRPDIDLSDSEIPRKIAVKVLDLKGSTYSPDNPEKSYAIVAAINEFMIARLLSSGSKNPNIVTGKPIEPMEKGSVPEYFGVTPIKNKESKKLEGYAFAMQKIEGTDLKKELEKRRYIREKFEAEHSSEGTTPLERGIYLREAIKEIVEIARIAKELADRNIVYNDFKPQNIMIDKKGKVCLVDFGIAEFVNSKYSPKRRRFDSIVHSKINMLRKMAADSPEITAMDRSYIEAFIEKFEIDLRKEQAQNPDENLEKPDLFTIRRMYIPGTLEYLAPEKIEPKYTVNPDLKSDIFSLGIIFLEYLYGDKIFNDANLPESDCMDMATELAKRKRNLEYVNIKAINKQARVRDNESEFILPLEDKLVDVLMSTISPDIEERPSADELLTQLDEISIELNEEAHWSLKDATSRVKTDKIKPRA